MWCSMIKKNKKTKPETDIWVQLECQKSKTAKGSYLYLSLKWWSFLQESQNETVRVVAFTFIFFSSSGIKTAFQFIWQTSVATGIKGMYHQCLFCKVDQNSCFTLWPLIKLYLLKYKWNMTTMWFFLESPFVYQ